MCVCFISGTVLSTAYMISFYFKSHPYYVHFTDKATKAPKSFSSLLKGTQFVSIPVSTRQPSFNHSTIIHNQKLTWFQQYYMVTVIIRLLQMKSNRDSEKWGDLPKVVRVENRQWDLNVGLLSLSSRPNWLRHGAGPRDWGSCVFFSFSTTCNVCLHISFRHHRLRLQNLCEFHEKSWRKCGLTLEKGHLN